MGKKRKGLKLAAGVLVMGGAVFGTAAFATAAQGPELPVKDPAVQVAYENAVASFLLENSEPQSGDFDSSTEGRNDYWRAMAAWWESIPWEAVAGQWGCLSSGSTVTFNPADERGVITAGHGGTGTCGGVDIGGYDAIFTVLETRSTFVEENLDQF